ncbi:hypothetical protein ACIQXD_05190 [Streptomyces uncialis]|uniref:hypothetical protein n=1 Tax=Streptomyces uncialis TaxID=1048205 RepID=UPI003827B220
MAATHRPTHPDRPRGDYARPRPPREPEPESGDHDLDELPGTADAPDALEAEAEGRYVTAPLCGEDLRIIPTGAWRQSWRRLLQAGDVDAFAACVLHPDDVEVYEDLDPTNDEFGDFIARAAERAGESEGKSRGPARSSRRTRRR